MCCSHFLCQGVLIFVYVLLGLFSLLLHLLNSGGAYAYCHCSHNFSNHLTWTEVYQLVPSNFFKKRAKSPLGIKHGCNWHYILILALLTFLGVLVFFVLLGFFGLILHCSSFNNNDPCLAGCRNCCYGWGILDCFPASMEACFALVIIFVIVFAILGIAYGFLAATMAVQRIWQSHYHILTKRELTKVNPFVTFICLFYPLNEGHQKMIAWKHRIEVQYTCGKYVCMWVCHAWIGIWFLPDFLGWMTIGWKLGDIGDKLENQPSSV